MKTKIRFIMVLGIMTIAMVTAGVPAGRQSQGTDKTVEVEIVTDCYTEEEIQLLMEMNHYQREEAIELLELSCRYAIKN
jgi:hypothetical protein